MPPRHRLFPLPIRALGVVVFQRLEGIGGPCVGKVSFAKRLVEDECHAAYRRIPDQVIGIGAGDRIQPVAHWRRPRQVQQRAGEGCEAPRQVQVIERPAGILRPAVSGQQLRRSLTSKGPTNNILPRAP